MRIDIKDVTVYQEDKRKIDFRMERKKLTAVFQVGIRTQTVCEQVSKLLVTGMVEIIPLINFTLVS